MYSISTDTSTEINTYRYYYILIFGPGIVITLLQVIALFTIMKHVYSRVVLLTISYILVFAGFARIFIPFFFLYALNPWDTNGTGTLMGLVLLLDFVLACGTVFYSASFLHPEA
jgi:hypothetical protein